MALYLLFAQPLSLQVSLIHFFFTPTDNHSLIGNRHLSWKSGLRDQFPANAEQTRKLFIAPPPVWVFAHLSGLWQVVVEVVSTSADQCFHTAPVALGSLITTWGWLRERRGRDGGGGGIRSWREREEGGEAHLFIAGFYLTVWTDW